MMVILILSLAVAYALACMAAGFGPAGDLAGFRPDGLRLDRRFRQAPDVVRAAYVAAAGRTPGMRLVEERDDQLLVDLRPTSRILDGNFGLVIRLSIAPDGAGTVVRGEARRKVPFAFLANDHAAFEHAERALRQRAKSSTVLDEVIPGLDVGFDLTTEGGAP